MGVKKEVALIDDRLRQMLINHKKQNPNKIANILKSEIFFVLKNYMDIKLEDIKFDIGIDNDGRYLLNMNAEVARLYTANYLL